MSNSEMYTVSQVAYLLAVNEETVRRWVRKGELKGVKESKKKGIRIDPKDLGEFLYTNHKYSKYIGVVRSDINERTCREEINSMIMEASVMIVKLESFIDKLATLKELV